MSIIVLIANVLDLQAGLAASPRFAWAPLIFALASTVRAQLRCCHCTALHQQ